MSNIFTKLRAIPDVLLALGMIQADVDQTLKDPRIKDRITADPVLGDVVQRLSREWRDVQEAVKRLR